MAVIMTSRIKWWHHATREDTASMRGREDKRTDRDSTLDWTSTSSLSGTYRRTKHSMTPQHRAGREGQGRV